MGIHVDRGLALHRQGKLDLAEQQYLLAVGEDFDDWQALLFLGTLYLQKNHIAMAAQLFMRSIDIHRDCFESWNNLGNCFKAVNKEPDAKACWEQALKVPNRKPDDYADVYNNLCTLYINAGCPKEAEKFAQMALDINLDHADANWNFGLAKLEQGLYKEGFAKYPWGFKTKNRQMRAYGDKVKYWAGEKDKVVVTWGEQGIGDEILFASMIPDLQNISKKVIFDCHPRLINIFKNSFPDVVLYGTRKDNIIGWHHDHKDLTHKIIIGDLTQYFRKDVKDFTGEPYLKAGIERVSHYKTKLAKLGTRLKVGISWAGGYTKTRKDYRSIPLEQWLPILKQDADFISLQYTPDAFAQVAEMEDKYDIKIHHWPSAVHNDDYHETAALVSALDLIITIDTSVHHLAGALGKKCWTLSPVGKAWRYWSPDEDGHSIPWYKSVYQYQQQTLGDWEPIIKRVAEDLGKEVAK